MTDEVEALASTQHRPPHQSPAATASPHRGRQGTRLRRPYLFPCAGKDRGEKSAWGCGVLSASEFRREPGLQASFHSGVTLRAFDYAPPDTEVSDLQLVAVERLLSIEGALEIQMNFTFLREPCRGGALLRPFFRRDRHPRAEQSPAPTRSPQEGNIHQNFSRTFY